MYPNLVYLLVYSYIFKVLYDLVVSCVDCWICEKYTVMAIDVI